MTPGRQAEGLARDDPRSGFRSGSHALDDYFRRHALINSETGVGRAYVIRKRDSDDPSLPAVLGYYTLSMALVAATAVAGVLSQRLPKYPMPVALIGRLAVDERARGRRIGEALLVDALRRVADAATLLGCVGVVVDAKDAVAEGFYLKYGFCTIEATTWPRRLFLPIATVRDAVGRRA